MGETDFTTKRKLVKPVCSIFSAHCLLLRPKGLTQDIISLDSVPLICAYYCAQNSKQIVGAGKSQIFDLNPNWRNIKQMAEQLKTTRHSPFTAGTVRGFSFSSSTKRLYKTGKRDSPGQSHKEHLWTTSRGVRSNMNRKHQYMVTPSWNSLQWSFKAFLVQYVGRFGYWF